MLFEQVRIDADNQIVIQPPAALGIEPACIDRQLIRRLGLNLQIEIERQGCCVES